MANLELMRTLKREAETQIVLLILDGLGGLAVEPGGPTELEAANTPNLDRLASEGTLGQTVPVGRGITPGSGPAHLALFGYDPLHFDVGRGVLEASGIGMRVDKDDVAARGNFVTLNANGAIVDRRAGRISSEEAAPLVSKLSEIDIEGVEAEVRVAREYRFSLILRGDGLEAEIADTDPLRTDEKPLPARALDAGSKYAADRFNAWIAAAQRVLKDESKANGVTLRGFSTNPALPQFPDIYGLNAAAIAVYPMYRGVAQIVGMDVIEFAGETPAEEFEAARANWSQFDYFFIHIKKVDSLGEDGDFEGKAAYIESVDHLLPDLLSLEPDVLAVTGDHSTPARLRSHSWHPVPLLLWAPATVRRDGESKFGELFCARGGLGTLPAEELMPLMMAHAGRLAKYGA